MNDTVSYLTVYLITLTGEWQSQASGRENLWQGSYSELARAETRRNSRYNCEVRNPPAQQHQQGENMQLKEGG